ncbi:hypothetical protein GCM10027034_25070 [Ramlibacter solisilvae]|uniref:Uncharacterized protein n=1 Tax=Ramlibacter tataouinensis TaxID=94132 RepID=A0A127JQ90_9BURK|nr:hypothetical protein [Ramlibacter tataouinensis]AMO22198.1 hypothetical protein UC35_03960 [Ramlibacter tataouinensis]
MSARQEALRRCALTLHSVAKSDREWLLARLPDQQRGELATLLGELEALGIPPDRAMVKIATRPSPAARRPARIAPASPQHVSLASPQDVAMVLRHEPAAVIARVLDARGAQERDAVLSRLGPAKRREVQELKRSHDARRAPGEGARLYEVLREEFEARLLAQVAARPATISHALSRRWYAARGRLGALLA